MANYPIGKYMVGLLGEQGYSETSTGNTQFFMKFKPFAVWDHSTGQFVNCDEYPRTFYRVLTANTAQYAAEDFRAMGFQGSKFAELDPRHPNAHIFSGDLEMTCTHETYDGKVREKWQIVRNTAGREEKAVEKDAVKKLDMLFGKALAAVPAASAPAPQRQPQPVRHQAPQAAVAVADLGITDDDVPF